VHLAARQQVGHRVADEFADAQLALRASGRAVAMMTFCHSTLSDVIIRESG